MPSLYVADYYIQYREEEPDQNNVTNNNLFVGSSAELLKMIKDNSNG